MDFTGGNRTTDRMIVAPAWKWDQVQLKIPPAL
jgi:hypothetical protein